MHDALHRLVAFKTRISGFAVGGSGGWRLRGAGTLAWGLWAVCLLATAGALALAGYSDLAGDERLRPDDVAFLVGFLVFPTVGALVASRQPANAVGWLFLVIALVWCLINHLGHFYAQYALIENPGALPGGTLVAWLTTWGWLPSLGMLLTFVLLLFPDGRLLSRRWSAVAWLAGGAIVVGSAAFALGPGPLGSERQFTTVDNPYGIARLERVLDVLEGVSIALLLCCGLASAASLFVRLRRVDAVQRQQIKWVVYAGSLVVLAILTDAVTRHMDADLERGIASVIVSLALFGVPVAAGIAMLRYRLWDIDLIINRTLVYGALTLGVVAIYVLAVAYLGRLFHAEEGLITSLIATGLVAVLFQPLRAWLQRGVNRLMYGERDDPYGVMARLGRRLEATLAPEAVLPTIVETIAQTLKLPYAAIALQQGDGFALAATTGAPAESTLRLPLVYQSETVGRLELAPRAPGEAFSPADHRLLEGIAHQAGIAAHAVRLTADLQRSRERLVTAREEERRRIRRDLHDGLGPALASLTLQLDAARNLVAHDPAEAGALLVDLKAQVQCAIADIRGLVYDLRPPALDELGLAGALYEQAARYGATPGEADGLVIRVDAAGLPARLPAAVEVAAYRIAVEAMTNAVRHARARRCQVRLWLDGGLHIEVSDDGVGLPAAFEAGVGFRSMRERAEELGGTCQIQRAPAGGSQVRAHLPLAPALGEDA